MKKYYCSEGQTWLKFDSNQDSLRDMYTCEFLSFQCHHDFGSLILNHCTSWNFSKASRINSPEADHTPPRQIMCLRLFLPKISIKKWRALRKKTSTFHIELRFGRRRQDVHWSPEASSWHTRNKNSRFVLRCAGQLRKWQSWSVDLQPQATEGKQTHH